MHRMFSYFQSNIYSIIFFIILVNLHITKTTNDHRADEYIMTSAMISGLQRSNICGEGYRIEGALLKSHPYSKHQVYLPYENCYMTFQTRRANHQIRIRILTMDINDIHAGVNCFDSLRFYQSAYIRRQDKLDSMECGQLSESENFNIISPTGIVTAHFTSDGGNVSGLGFQVVLTAFRSANKTHPCDPNDDEFLCNNAECISSSLLCDGIVHCLDDSDEDPSRCGSEQIITPRPVINKPIHQRAISVFIFLLLVLIISIVILIYFVYHHHSIRLPISLLNHHDKGNYSAITQSPTNGLKSEIVRANHNYNLI